MTEQLTLGTGLMGYIREYLKNDTIRIMIETRETCPHWIDYRIFDQLSDELKEVYVNQFYVPNFCYRKDTGKYMVLCNNGPKDPLFIGKPDCTCHYKKTLAYFKRSLENPFRKRKKKKTEETLA